MHIVNPTIGMLYLSLYFHSCETCNDERYLFSMTKARTEPWSECIDQTVRGLQSTSAEQKNWQPELVVNIYYAFDHDQTFSSDLGLPCLHISIGLDKGGYPVNIFLISP